MPKTQEISQEDAIKKRGGDIDKLCEKYEDLKKVDKVRAAQSEVKGLENELQVGIQKLKSNKDVLQ